MAEHCTINAYGKSLRRKGKSAVAVFPAKAPCPCACDKLIPSQRRGSGMWIFLVRSTRGCLEIPGRKLEGLCSTDIAQGP